MQGNNKLLPLLSAKPTIQQYEQQPLDSSRCRGGAAPRRPRGPDNRPRAAQRVPQQQHYDTPGSARARDQQQGRDLPSEAEHEKTDTAGQMGHIGGRPHHLRRKP